MRKNRHLLLELISLLVFSSCTSLNKEIAFLNSKKLCLFTYQTNYKKFNEFNNYKILKDDNDLNQVNADYYCIAFNNIDDEIKNISKDTVKKIYSCFNQKNCYIYFYGFKDLKFLENTELDYKPKGDDYTVTEGETIIYTFSKYQSSFIKSDLSMNNNSGKMSFEDTIICDLYNNIYKIESQL